jgi:hypothetical protein
VVQSGNPSGRPKGSRNKLTLEVIDRLEALGCDPIEGMARIAMDEKAELSLRAQMYKELAQYVAPKRKAVEVTGEDGDSLQMELKSLIEEIQNTLHSSKQAQPSAYFDCILIRCQFICTSQASRSWTCYYYFLIAPH